ncbi:MAG: ABC transporter ATP-binding protein, partial [Desulfurococcaceae archaeon]
MTTEIALDVKNLWFKYPIGDWVLRGANLTLHSGEQVLIIGDTGSGKTTLLRALTKVGQVVYGGELRGEVLVEGKSLENLQLEEIFKYVHVIGQNPYLYFTEPIVHQDLLSYACRVHGDQEVAARSVSRAVESTRVHKLLTKCCFELSGGEARRALVAKSLVADPIVFAFDEPLMWLDDQGVGDFIELLRLLKNLGKSALVFEHRFLPIYRHFN